MAKKKLRKAETDIAEILNNLAQETGCHVQLDIDSRCTIDKELPTYITDITLTI